MEYAMTDLIRQFQLAAHPEGGYYYETYVSPDIIGRAGMPDRYSSERRSAKAIYFLLPSDQVSKFHRIKCEEIWCHHFGEALTLFLIHRDGSVQEIVLGAHIERGELPQIIIPHNVWFGAKVNKKNAYAFLSCITAPGFEFQDFELAERNALLQEYPQHRELIIHFTN